MVSRAPALMRDKFIERFLRLNSAAQAQSLEVLKSIADMMDAQDVEEPAI